MYNVIKQDGTKLGYVEQPVYIEKMYNGSYGLTIEANATGIAFNGAAYNIVGKPVLDEALDTVIISEVDGGALLNEQVRQLQEAAESQAALEDAACELAIATEERFSEIEDAICELAIVRSGGDA